MRTLFVISMMMLNAAGCNGLTFMARNAATIKTDLTEAVKDTGAYTLEKGEIEKLQETTFDDLLVVMERVKRNAQTLTIDEALNRIGNRLPTEVLTAVKPQSTMIQSDNGASPNATSSAGAAGHAQIQGKKGAPAPSPFGKGTKLEKAMRFLNAEFKDIREKMDVKLFECGFFKVEKEGALHLVQSDIDRLAEEIGMLEKDIAYAKLMIEAQQRELERLQTELASHLASCQETREALIAERNLIQEDLDVATIILDVADKECSKATMMLEIKACTGEDGSATFMTNDAAMQTAINRLRTPKAKAAAERMLFEASALDEDSLPGAAPQEEAFMQEDVQEPKDADSAVPDYFNHPAKEADNNDKASDHATKLAALKKRVVKATPPAKVAKGPKKSDANNFCPVGVKPNCAQLMDKLGNMKGEIQDSLDDKIAELNRHNQECDRVEKDYKEDIAQCNEQISTYNVQLMEATAQKQAKQATGIQRETERHEICEIMREKYAECHKEIKLLEEELCGIFKVRQSTYQQMKGESPDIQDCMLGPWVPGECSKSCVGADGVPGTQTMFRKIVAEKNTFGAECPPMKLARACETQPCPIDCKVSEWAGWSRCTKDCGGGSQSRTREVVVPDDHGGEPCPETTEGRACNTESCDEDCVLKDWASWGPCTKSCKANHHSEPGHQYRRKHIRKPIKGAGTCPKPDQRERYEYRTCNDFNCPPDPECVAAMDMVIMLDGSGSLWNRGPRKVWDKNFQLEKQYTVEIIKHSKMDGFDLMEQEDEGKYPTHARIGVILFASRVQVVSKLSGKKDPLIAAVNGLKWPMGATQTHLALDQAMAMLQYTRSDRLQTVMTITDGRPTNRGATFRMAEMAKRRGIRQMVVPVGRGIKDSDICKMASAPCIDNVEKSRDWPTLIKDLTRFVAGSCPVIAAPAKAATTATR